MLDKAEVHGFTVAYDESTRSGVKYLLDDLSYEEARVFFDQARLRGSSAFEDDEDRDFTLFYQNGAYVLARRS